jgi:peptide-methionine (R)-S-oxide reductase
MRPRDVTDDEWEARMTPELYGSLLQQGVNGPFTGHLQFIHEEGEYRCALCGHVIFRSDATFEQGESWPIFSDMAEVGAFTLRRDLSHGRDRIEVSCAVCGAYLGDLFNDSHDVPPGVRFCNKNTASNYKREGRET